MRLFAEVSEWVPDNVISTGLGGFLLIVLARLVMYFKEHVVDEMSRRLVEAGKRERKMRARIEELEESVRSYQQENWILKQQAGRINPPSDDSDK